jgi:hypothetical protein
VIAVLILLVQAPAQPADSAIIAAVRAAAEREPVEAMGPLRPQVPVKDVRLLDVDGDGEPEAFVWIVPAARQTPTILVYTYDARRGAQRVLEALVPGRLQPVRDLLVDDHTLGYGIDAASPADSDSSKVDIFISAGAKSGMSVVRYRTFLHADSRKGFRDYVDLADRALPTRDTENCVDFEFSPVEAIAVGTLPGKGATRYLVALTSNDVTTYRFRRIRANGRLDKETLIEPRPPDVTGLTTSAGGEVQLVHGGRTPPAAPQVLEPVTSAGVLHVMDPARGMSKQPATNRAIAGKIADAAREYRRYAPIPRGAFYDLAWPKDTAEYRRMAGCGLLLVTVVDQTAAELPLARAYLLRADGRDSNLTLLGSIASETPATDTSARAVFGRYRFDALYLVPLAPEWRGGVVVIDFTQGRQGFRVGQVAVETPPELVGATRHLAPSPDTDAVLLMIRREYPDFVVTK